MLAVFFGRTGLRREKNFREWWPSLKHISFASIPIQASLGSPFPPPAHRSPPIVRDRQSLTILANHTILEWNTSKQFMPLNENLTPQFDTLLLRNLPPILSTTTTHIL